MIKRFYKSDSNFVLVRLTGKVTDEQMRRHVIEYNREVSDREGLLELVDCRELVDVSELTVTGLIAIANLEKGAKRVIGGKLVFLVTAPLHYGLARVYTSNAELVRSGVNVFYTLEDAICWLGVKESPEEIAIYIDVCNQP